MSYICPIIQPFDFLILNFHFLKLSSAKLVFLSAFFSSSIVLIVYKRYSSEFLEVQEPDRLFRRESVPLKFLAGRSDSSGLRKFAVDDACSYELYISVRGSFLYKGHRSVSIVKADDYYSYNYYSI